MISGEDADGDQTGTVEEIDFTDANPRWKIVGSILQPLATTKAVCFGWQGAHRPGS